MPTEMSNSEAETMNPEQPMSKPTIVSIGVWHGVLLVDPAVEALEAELAYSRLDFKADGASGCTAAVTEYNLYARDAKNRLIIPTGLVSRAAAILRSMGHDVTITDHRQFGADHNPDPDVLHESGGEDRRFLNTVAGNPIGQIKVTGDREAGIRIMQMCRLFGKANILIVAASRRTARSLRWMLSHRFGDDVGLAVSGIGVARRRIMVTTPLCAGIFGPCDAQVVLLANASEASGEHVKQAFSYISQMPARRYAFVHQGQRLGWGERLSLEAMSGPVIYTGDCEPADVLVYLAGPCKAPRIHGYLTDLGIKRRTIWNNDERNNLVADIAKACVDQNTELLERVGLQQIPSELISDGSQPPVVSILVESTEHGRQLMRWLPGWQLMSLRHDGNVEPSAGQEIAGQIVTVVYAALHGIHSDILIRADGGADGLSIKDFPPPFASRPQGVAIIDVYDAGNERTGRQTQGRLKAYSRLGWPVLTADLHIPYSSSRQTNAGNTTRPAVPTQKGGKLPIDIHVTNLPMTHEQEVAAKTGTRSFKRSLTRQEDLRDDNKSHEIKPADVDYTGKMITDNQHQSDGTDVNHINNQLPASSGGISHTMPSSLYI